MGKSAIGIWGGGESGKTALATHIHHELIRNDIKVIWVTVSQNSILHLQKVIAKSIDLDISDEYEVKTIALKLFQAFKEMNKCVIILDDVWDHFLLRDIGFPISNDRIKLILTTRIREVCQGMDCEKVIKVKPLDEEDSWALFVEFLGLFYKELSSEVENIARNVAQKCEGFPLAIVRIATSMKGKTEAREWRHMLECLENLDNGQYEMDKWVFPVLRSSYDFLIDEFQRFFLYCILSTDGNFDNDDADHLIRRFVYESIDERKKLGVQYNEGWNMLRKLKNHSMLDYDDVGYWMTNKFLRVLAVGIAEETGKIMRKASEKLTEIPSDDQWKEDLQKVFLMWNEIQTIPDGTCPRCSQLSTLLLNHNAKLNYISDDFFNNMPTLKTLDLSETGIKRLPRSVSSLECLTALLLSGCRKLSFIPSLRKLKRLISLDLFFTAISEAPVGLESLVNLRYLNLLHTDKLVMSISLISKLTNLEHLELGGPLYKTDVTVQDMKELDMINCQQGTGAGPLCTVLSYGHNNNPHQIELLDICLYDDVEYLWCCNCPFCCSFQLVGRLRLSALNKLKSFVSPHADSLHQSTLFSHLTDLEIQDCDSMETLIAFELAALLQNLRTICVRSCEEMKEIFGEDHSVPELVGVDELMALLQNSCLPPSIELPRLTSLELFDMPQLDLVYRGIMICPSLQTFYSESCNQLRPPQRVNSNNVDDEYTS
ncbi:probable disease resistance protein At4g27220 [Neltuma alba]|uniref:probable disease resistance protein At4g27220 n=1 Tax=Neltuma alba TaxID=207710 RepID=UPI0010A35BC5|nr:probable disease resistance protein At4g27220 [Prosopis alba]